MKLLWDGKCKSRESVYVNLKVSFEKDDEGKLRR